MRLLVTVKFFFENTNASGVIPQISVIMGPCAGGAVYSPALTDFIYMVKHTSQMFITGPAVIKSVTGEEVTAEDLVVQWLHNSVSGVAHFAAEDEDDCIAQIRYLLGFLPSNNMEDAPLVDTGDDPTREDEGLNSLLPDNSNMPYDMKDVIAATEIMVNTMKYNHSMLQTLLLVLHVLTVNPLVSLLTNQK